MLRPRRSNRTAPRRAAPPWLRVSIRGAALALSLLMAAEARGETPRSDGAALAEAWQRAHPDQVIPPRCKHPDPVRRVQADLDPRPGEEVALASLRFGLVLLGADGQVIATHRLECGDSRYATPDNHAGVVELRAARVRASETADLILRTRNQGHCGSIGELMILGRREAFFETLLVVEDEVELECGSNPVQSYRGSIEVEAPGRLRYVVKGDYQPHVGRGRWGTTFTAERIATFALKGNRFVHEAGRTRVGAGVLLDAEPTIVRGSVDPFRFAEDLRIQAMGLVDCYTLALRRRRDMKGTIDVTLVHSPSGDLRVTLDRDDLLVPSVTRCLKYRMGRFLLGAKPYQVSYRLRFEPAPKP